jgi:RNA polymerase sigma-70 factor (ECF subfamily)
MNRVGIPDERKTMPADADLIAAARAGQRSGFDGLVQRYLDRVIGFLHYLSAPPASVEDIAQETFLKAFQRLKTFDPSRPFLNWLLGIARNTLSDARRKQARDNEALRETVQEQIPGRDPAEVATGKLQVEQLLGTLSEADRFLLELRVFQRIPFAEIAELTGEGVSTVKSRLYRILSKLEERL